MRLSCTLSLLILLSGCGLFGGGGDDAALAARALLVKGDLEGGLTAYKKAYADNPSSVDAAIGASYAAYLGGDYAGADKILADVEEKAKDRKGEVVLRRALVAMKSNDLDKVRTLGEASGLEVGLLLAAEVALADGEREAAAKNLEAAAKSADSAVASTAAGYQALLKDANPLVQGLSEAEALWALGQREVATKSVEEIIKSLPEDNERKPELLLLWSGRAASAGQAQVALNLVESIAFPPAGQSWRVNATRGIVAAAEGDAVRAKAAFDALEGQAPAAGLADARATAAMILAKKDPSKATMVLGDEATVANARAMMAAGDLSGARKLAPDGFFASYLSQ